MDFYQIKERYNKKSVEIYPEFKIGRSKDFMVRGKAFYGIWDEEAGLWSTDEYQVQKIIDKDLNEYAKVLQTEDKIVPKYMSDFSSNSWLSYRNYVTHVSDNSKILDSKIAFSNTEVKKSDYISKRLSYPLEKGTHEAFDKIIGTLYSEEERQKIEWAIGAIVTGEAKHIQKFIVLYGDAGAGKSTILNIIQKLFDGYYTTFEAKALTSSNNAFSTSVFKDNPLVAIQHDGDLSKIEDNTKLNSIISHEEIVINEKYKSGYSERVNCFLFMATNKPVKITDGKSGIIRRLIDVRPSGHKLTPKDYQTQMSKIDFELGAIAYHCQEVYRNLGKNYYGNYRPIDMMYKTDPFFNFVEDSYDIFKEQDSTTVKQAYSMYKEYCESSGSDYKLQMYKFREELKNYFKCFEDRAEIDNKTIRSYYSGFITKKFDRIAEKIKEKEESEHPSAFLLDSTESIFDKMCEDCPAQYATVTETPGKKWELVKTKLIDIDTTKIHYVRVPKNHIVIDFDIKDEKGEKSFEKNIQAASNWPKTYAELSKGGAGVHLHYIYTGDVNELNRIFDTDIEVKVFTGNSSLRRKLSKCNNIPVSTISSGLPLKAKGDKMVNFEGVASEKGLRTSIKKALNKEVHASTKPNIDFITDILDKAYKNGMKYDVTDMRPSILAFAAESTHQADYCIKAVNKMKFKSEDVGIPGEYKNDIILYYDVEVFKNVLIICYKRDGGKEVVKMINPAPTEVEDLLQYKLIGFNCRRYDNHIIYARMMGYSNEQLYKLSQRIINTDKKSSDKNCFFGEAYNLSYTDVYDYLSSGNKMGLKKWEIKLGIHHQENSYPWDEPLSEEHWDEVADYCCNDVIATEAVHKANKADWTARQILASLANMTVNDTTNSLTTRIIFGNNKHPQSEFNWRNLAEPIRKLDSDVKEFLDDACPDMMNQPHGQEKSVLPYFEGYQYELGVSTYRGEEVGEGGYVYAEPGMYGNVALLDVSSMHPRSVISECLFGPEFTKAFQEIVEGRVSIKHEDWDAVKGMLNGKLVPFVEKVTKGEMSYKDLANALKTAINSVYGLTAAMFDNPFKDIQNIDNIVAKRGALFMVDLKHEVQKRGFTVAHIKTDSIKIPDATPEIINFVMDYGLKYGYSFEHEETYDRMCLVNNAVYIAKYKTPHIDKDTGKEIWWTPTGKQFAVPYVFKTLFSKENINIDDMCETMSVQTALYLDLNEKLEDDEHNYRFIGKVGNFCPIKAGCGGGELLREGLDKQGNVKYNSASGAKGYRWLEAEMVKNLNKEDDIDFKYYNSLVDAAIKEISKYGDYEWFISDDPYTGKKIYYSPQPEDLPFI